MAITVTYNGQSVPNVQQKFIFTESYEEVGFTCQFLVKGTSAANLVSLCKNLEAKFREPYDALTLNFGGTAEYSFSHSANTCLNPKVSIEKTGSGVDTETSRMYKFSFRAELPADKSGFDFRRRGDFSITTNGSGLKVVSFQLEYTASPGSTKTAIENFDSFAQVYANSVLSSLFSTTPFDLAPIVRSADMNNKICSGSLVYTEIFEPQTAAAVNSNKLINVQISYSIDRRQRIGISSSGYIAIPQTYVNVSYSAELVKSQFTTHEEVHDFYRNELKLHIVQRAIVNLNIENVTNAGSSFIIQDDKFSFNPGKFTCNGTIRFLAPNSLTAIIELEEQIIEDWGSGQILRDLWDGKDFTAVGYHQGASLFVTRITTIVQLGSRPAPPSILPQQNFVLLRRKRTGSIFQENSHTEAGNQNVRYFAETFIESYQRAEVINEVSIQIPAITFAPEE